MRKLFGFIIAAFCLMWISIPVQAQTQVSTNTHTASAKHGKARKAPRVVQAHKAGKYFRDCANCPVMMAIPAGDFGMGSPDSESGRSDDEGPLHRVNIAAFALGKTEITRGQFAAFANETKYRAGNKCWTLEKGKIEEREGDWRTLRYGQENNHPIGCVNWNDAQAYAKWLSRKTGNNYHLPTEAEWEYSARGNTSRARYWGDNPDDACGYANVADQTARAQIHGASSWSTFNCTDGFAYTAPMGSFKANAFGLFDMLGNVWEWTEDSYHDSYKDAPTDGSAWQGDGAKRLLRGGSWNSGPKDARAATRNSYKPELRFSFFGFRIARALP